MIGYHEALAMLKQDATRLGVERIPLAEANGRILACALTSTAALPPFDNAAMDGYAVASAGQTLHAGREWLVEGCAVAGEPPRRIGTGALEIMTGAMLPPSADTVVPVEKTEHLPASQRVRLLADMPAGVNVRRQGEDVRAGQMVMAAGEALWPSRLLLLAGVGAGEIEVARRPRIALLATGRELGESGQTLAPGEIHDASTPYLALALAAAGAQLVQARRVGDDVAEFQAALDDALSHGVDLVVSTGAVSKGRHDFVPAALHARGADTMFHGVAIRPGKPVFAARLREGPLFIGLPGNPVSSAVGLRFFVEPLIRAWLGMPDEAPLRLPLARACVKRYGLRAHFHADVRCDAEGRLRAHVSAQQESFRLLPLRDAAAWVVLPEESGDAEAGQQVDVHGLCHLHSPRWAMEPAA